VTTPIIPFFDNTKVYSWFVYHNDKYNRPGGSRDEYRIYLNKGLDFSETTSQRIYQPNDIVVFERLFQDDDLLMPVYFMYRFGVDSEHYSTLNELIIKSKGKGGHGFYEGNLLFIQSSLSVLEQAEVEIAEDAKKEIEKQQNEVLEIEEESTISEQDDIEAIRGAHLFNPTTFREFVLLAYNCKCAITGQAIVWKKLNNLEAAHIQPKAQAGTYLPCNGIALSRDMHWAFDKGFITINQDFCVEVHPEMKDTLLQQYHGQKIIVPVEPYFQPAEKFIKHHNTRIFGLFKHSGSIRSL